MKRHSLARLGDIRKQAQPSTSRGYEEAQPGTSRGYEEAQPGTSRGYEEAQPGTSRGYEGAQPGPSRGYEGAQPGPSRGYEGAQPGPSRGYEGAQPGPSRGYEGAQPGPSRGYEGAQRDRPKPPYMKILDSLANRTYLTQSRLTSTPNVCNTAVEGANQTLPQRSSKRKIKLMPLLSDSQTEPECSPTKKVKHDHSRRRPDGSGTDIETPSLLNEEMKHFRLGEENMQSPHLSKFVHNLSIIINVFRLITKIQKYTSERMRIPPPSCDEEVLFLLDVKRYTVYHLISLHELLKKLENYFYNFAHYLPLELVYYLPDMLLHEFQLMDASVGESVEEWISSVHVPMENKSLMDESIEEEAVSLNFIQSIIKRISQYLEEKDRTHNMNVQ